jgi:uncharacterized damage-inducible protein DinB
MINDLGHYYVWANNKFREALAKLSEDEFNLVDEKVGRSIKELAIHSITTNEMYYKPVDEVKKLDEELKTKSKDEILEFWSKSDEDFAKVVENMKEEPVTFPISENEKITVNALENLLMYTDHSTFHRGQLLSAIKYLGQEGISSDYYYYLVERNSKKSE